MTLLRWITFPFVCLFFQLVALILSNLYFNWLLPPKAGIDWLIIILLLPISLNAISLQYFAVLAGIMVSPNQKIGRYLIIATYIYGIILQANIIGFSFDRLNIIINTIESCIASIMLIIGLFDGGRFDKNAISSFFPSYYEKTS